MKKFIYASLVTVLFFASCTPKILYLGNDLGSSSNIQTFYGEMPKDAKYDVIGIATNKVDKGDLRQNKLNKIQEAMIKKAKSKGADAIVFTTLRRENVGSTGTLNSGSGITVIIPGVQNHPNTNANRINTTDQKKNVIEAQFIKFKN